MINRLLLIAGLLCSPVSFGGIWQVDFPPQVQKDLQELKSKVQLDGRYFFAEGTTSIQLAADLIEKTAVDQDTLGYSLKKVCSDSYQGGSCILGQRVKYGYFLEQIDQLNHQQPLSGLTSWLEAICRSGCHEYEVELEPNIQATILFTVSQDRALLFYHSL